VKWWWSFHDSFNECNEEHDARVNGVGGQCVKFAVRINMLSEQW